MSDTTVVREVKGRLRLDVTDLDKASSATKQFGKNVEQHVGGSSVHTLRAEQAFTTLIDRVEGMPPVVNQAARSLESIHSQGGAVISALGGAGTIATIAGAAVLAFATESTKHYMELAEQVLAYKRVTGESAEESSRMVEVANVLGVSSDTLASAMFRLNQRISAAGSSAKAHTPSLASLGVEISRNTNGSANLSATLANVADAYVAAGSGAEKDQILFAAFGRSGRDLIPILEQGSAGLKQMSDQASNVFTEKQIEQVHEYEIATKQLGKSWESVSMTIGQTLVPAMTSLTDATEYYLEQMKKDTQGTKSFGDQLKDNATNALPVIGPLLLGLGHQHDSAAYKARQHGDAQQRLADMLKRATDAASAQEKELDSLVNAEEAGANSAIALERANLHVSESEGKVEKAQDELNAAIARYGAGSEEAKTAAQNLANANLDQKQTFLDAAAAAASHQAALDKVDSGVANVKKDTEAYVAKLQEEANSLAPGSSLRTYLEQYIARLAAVPDQVHTNLTIHASSDDPSSYLNLRGFQRAAGGPVIPNRVYTVGEKGTETLVMGQSGGYVIPHAGSAAPAAGDQAAAGDTYNIGPIYGGAADPAAIAREIAWMRKTA